jgi:hypothetical protein
VGIDVDAKVKCTTFTVWPLTGSGSDSTDEGAAEGGVVSIKPTVMVI